MYIHRQIEKHIKTASKQFGAILLTGPRQSGKTTLVKHLFPKYTYINLEDPVTFTRVTDDPKSIISNIKHGIIIDEIQRFPELLSYIQVDIDANFQPGKFILTGSQNILISHKVSQTLAGRVAVFTLLPLTLKELANAKSSAFNSQNNDALDTILNGFYPGKLVRNLQTNIFYSSYLQTYVERDVRTIRNIGNLTNFKRFLALLAGRVGQLLNLSSLANDVGVSHKTINEWISILEASYVIFRLLPYHTNFGKRLIKTPKIYFWDTGIATYLLEINSTKELKNHFALGNLFENLIISDFMKARLHTLSTTNPYFWRDKDGHEIDFLLTSANKTYLFEIKSAFSYSSEFLQNLEYYQTLANQTQHKQQSQEKMSQKQNKANTSAISNAINTLSYVIYRGESLGQIRNTHVINWQEIIKLQDKIF